MQDSKNYESGTVKAKSGLQKWMSNKGLRSYGSEGGTLNDSHETTNSTKSTFPWSKSKSIKIKDGKIKDHLQKSSLCPKLIHLKLSGKIEIIEIPINATDEDVIAYIYDVAEIPKKSNFQIVLRDNDGKLMALNSKIASNKSETAYSVEFASSDITAESFQNFFELTANLPSLKKEFDSFSKEFVYLKRKLDQMDMDKVAIGKYPLPLNFEEVGVNPLSRIQPYFETNRKYELTKETIELLKSPTIDVWQFDSNEIIALLENIFETLGLIKEFNIERKILLNFLYKIRDGYNPNMYSIINTSGVVEKLKPVEKLILTIACIGHDLDHPGYNNSYQVNARTDLATTYNDISPLEMHHSASLFSILNNSESNILSGVSNAVFKEVRQGIIKCILATDMAKHGEILAAFKKADESTFNYEDNEHRTLLMQMIIKCSDISNEVRPAEVAEPWVDGLLHEFFCQSDREKAEGLPTAPFMDREKVTKPNAQVGFINFVMIPLYELIAKVLPNMDTFINPIKASMMHYKSLQK